MVSNGVDCLFCLWHVFRKVVQYSNIDLMQSLYLHPNWSRQMAALTEPGSDKFFPSQWSGVFLPTVAKRSLKVTPREDFYLLDYSADFVRTSPSHVKYLEVTFVVNHRYINIIKLNQMQPFPIWYLSQWHNIPAPLLRQLKCHMRLLIQLPQTGLEKPNLSPICPRLPLRLCSMTPIKTAFTLLSEQLQRQE